MSQYYLELAEITWVVHVETALFLVVVVQILLDLLIISNKYMVWMWNNAKNG